jgi:hypothetical protein
MTTAETVSLIAALLLIILVIGNHLFSKLAERRNPPVGKFIECDGVRLHNAVIPPLLASCCSMATGP